MGRQAPVEILDRLVLVVQLETEDQQAHVVPMLEHLLKVLQELLVILVELVLQEAKEMLVFKDQLGQLVTHRQDILEVLLELAV